MVDAGDSSARPPVTSEPRELHAVGDPYVGPLLGSLGGRNYLARCVGGVVVGIDYTVNGPEAATDSNRLTFVVPRCALLSVSGTSVSLGAATPVTWTEALADGTVAQASEFPELSTATTLACPPGEVVVAFFGGADPIVLASGSSTFAVRSFGIDCAALVLDVDSTRVELGAIEFIPASGIAPDPATTPIALYSFCGDQDVASGVAVRWGNWTDDVGVECSTLRWGFAAGHSCAVGDDCQSGVCSGSGTCAAP
jgi:hypothetical protein